MRSLQSRPLVATALTIQTTSIACYWLQAMHTPSDGYGLSIHRYPILRCGAHVPVVHNLRRGEGHMLHVPLKGSARSLEHRSFIQARSLR